MKHTQHQALQAQCRIDTPLGPLTLAATRKGLAAALFEAQAHHPGNLNAPVDAAQHHLATAAAEFEAYFAAAGASRFSGFSVPLDPHGTPFQQQVWQALLGIDWGQLSSYGEIAHRLALPSAARAVGAAVGHNPISIIVPCHRVVGRDGALTGYAGGLPRKRALLLHEGALLL